MGKRPGTKRHSVFPVIVGQKFILDFGHVHIGRALAPLQPCTQGTVKQLHIPLEVSSSSGRLPESAARKALVRPRVECSSSRVTM
jgi:hypothetical protein